MDSEIKARLWLAHAKITTNIAYKLFEIYGSASNVFDEFDNIPDNLINETARYLLNDSKNQLNKSVESLEKNDVSIISPDNSNYPFKLKAMDQPPYALFYKGNIKALNKNTVAIVGTRRPSNYGVKITREFAKSLGDNNVCVVSGFAMGVDTQAHQYAYKTAGGTAAVCGCGLAIDYPASNRLLRENIINNDGVMLSEYDCDTEPLNYHFPYRNRIITALSDIVIFVEGKINSGGMITVKYAYEQNVPVFAVPGNLGSELSEGPNSIIAAGEAKCILKIEDIFDELSISNSFLNIKSNDFDISENISGLQLEIYKALKLKPKSFGEIVDAVKTPPDKVQSAIAFLEIMGYIKRSPGNIYEV